MKQFFFTVLLLLVFAPLTQAIAPVPPEKTSFLGQDHYYSVTLRGNSEAVVTLKAILSNLEEKPLSKIQLRVSKVDPKDIAVYQVIKEPQCIRYAEESPVEIQIYPRPSRKQTCLEYQEPDYYQYSYGSAKYQKASYEMLGDTINITLPTSITSNRSGSFILYYRAVGYAKKNLFGAYDFTFETLKINDKIRTLQVGVSADSDLFLRGAKGKVNYRFEDMTTMMKSNMMDNFYQQIGQGEIYKKAENLQPLESYTVKGTYADSRLKLYIKDVLVGLLIFFLALVIVIFAVKITMRRTKLPNLFVIGGVSFATSMVILGYTLLLFFVSRLTELFGMYEYSLLIGIFSLIISIGVYAVLGIVPSLFVGMKKGYTWGIGTFIGTILWLVLYFFVTVLIIFFFQGNRYGGGIITPMQ